MWPLALDNVQDDGNGFGYWGLLIILGLIVASVVLFFLMRRSLSKVKFTEFPPERTDRDT